MTIRDEIYIEKGQVLKIFIYGNFLLRGLVGIFYGNLKSNSIYMKNFYKNKIKVGIDFNDFYYCHICNVNVSHQNKIHTSTQTHKRNIQINKDNSRVIVIDDEYHNMIVRPNQKCDKPIFLLKSNIKNLTIK